MDLKNALGPAKSRNSVQENNNSVSSSKKLEIKELKLFKELPRSIKIKNKNSQKRLGSFCCQLYSKKNIR
jgi:hypothetical protein